jgi:hypothetical protein
MIPMAPSCKPAKVRSVPPKRFATLLAIVLPSLSTACPSASDEPRRPAQVVVVEPSTDEPDSTAEPVAPIDEVIEIATPDLGHDPTAVPVTLAIATPVSVAWREVSIATGPPPSDLRFIYLASGVVGHSSAGIHEVGTDDRLVLHPGLTLPEGTLVGHWPDDVWSIETHPAAPTPDGERRFEYVVLRLEPQERQWVAQPYHGKERFLGEPLAVRKGWQAGLLIRENGVLTRLGSVKPAPDIGMRMGKLLLDTFETNSGELYTVSQRPTGVHVQGDCPDLECVKSAAKKLPFGISWSFSMQVPRQRKSLTIATHVDLDDAPGHYLLHFEVGGWKLETIDHAPTGLWANAEGGLWATLGAKLWYRSPSGDWFEVALPDGARDVTAALREDASELWIATRVDDQTHVYATSAMLGPGKY